MEFRDYYSTLGIGRSATEDEIQAAYRKLARRYHPDLNKISDAEERFKEIAEAYEVLGDSDRRSKYDRYGAAWKQMEQSGNGFGGFDYDPTAQGLGGGSFYDVLEHLFGAQYNGHNAPFTGFANRSGQEMHQRPSRGEDHEATIRLTLEDGARGGARTLSIPRPTGGSRKIKVKVPAGVLPGQKIRLVGQGGDCPGGPGDLYLRIEILPHPHLLLRGRDLHTRLRVPPWLAALGGERELSTLTGKARVSIPPGASSGMDIRLKGLGYPDGNTAGDLYAELVIEIPERLSNGQREAYEKLKSIDSEETRDVS